jgi:carbamoyl-phosphate synthase small subunit
MTGYQETLTDPSYHRQIVVQTAPHIGNTGVNDEDAESGRIWVSGYVVRDPAPRPSSWRATASLADALAAQGVVGISGPRHPGADPPPARAWRHAVRHLQRRHARPHERVLASPPMSGADLSAAVTTTEPYVVEAIGRTASPWRRWTTASRR